MECTFSDHNQLLFNCIWQRVYFQKYSFSKYTKYETCERMR